MTKSVRFSDDERDLISQVSEREHLSEGALLRKLVLDGLERYRLEQAIADYQASALNLGEAAARAGIGLQRFMVELDRRGVDTIDRDHFAASLASLVERFSASAELRQALPSGDTPRD